MNKPPKTRANKISTTVDKVNDLIYELNEAYDLNKVKKSTLNNLRNKITLFSNEIHKQAASLEYDLQEYVNYKVASSASWEGSRTHDWCEIMIDRLSGLQSDTDEIITTQDATIREISFHID